jgi:integrase/recombinase XerD
MKDSLNTRDWAVAATIAHGWEASGQAGVIKLDIPTIEKAVARYFDDATARHLATTTIRKRRELLEGKLLPFCKGTGVQLLKQLDVTALRASRNGWPYSALCAVKRLEYLRGFLRFCQDSGWIDTNSAMVLKAPKVTPRPTLPFEDAEVERILEAADQMSDWGTFGPKARAMVLLLRYSGLRMQDAACLERARLKDGKLFLYTQKTGTPVNCPLPPGVVSALNDLSNAHPNYFFWDDRSERETTVKSWNRVFRKVFRTAKPPIEGGHPHRFRDTFAVSLLLKGVELSHVSILLGHASIKVTERHYAPWVRARQEQLEADVQRTWADAPLGPVATAPASRIGRRLSARHLPSGIQASPRVV